MPTKRRELDPQADPQPLPQTFGLERHGIERPAKVSWNPNVPSLIEEAVHRQEGQVAQGGVLVVRTGQHTGRAPNDKFIVREPSSEARIGWGDVNKPFDARRFDQLHRRLLASYRGKDLFVQDRVAGTDATYQRRIRVVTETAWHSAFARTMFLDPPAYAGHESFEPDFTVLQAPTCYAQPERDTTYSPTFVLIHFGKKLILIGGTSYAGEIKKSVFTIMNYLLPLEGVLSMHCAANIGPSGDVALFFGLSGTGKTSLSADPRRTLIGDDEHGWSHEGVFNVEAGCYAKMIRLSPTAEPEIYGATRRFGTILENVPMDPATREVDLNDDSLTENTRGAYPIGFISNASPTGRGGHPHHVVMLTCDAFGVMPPISKLTPEQARYHFLSGYTAKVAGTEKGIKEPSATFSTCFGAPFMPLRPSVYATLLAEKIARHNASCWLVNTGWTGGPYGVGNRIPITSTRSMVEAALSGTLADAPVQMHALFSLAAVTKCPGVPDELLNPRATWTNPAAYDVKAQELAEKFQENFAQFAE
ncbi:MAG: phosphoenolpyruvate carboxykinase (ATP) [Candidatus Omnitrophica bacterium]|nr:phosphoenolpyruvate carboxykinase (ATP) [Candidatus Omnitrophota bacterium]